MKFARYVGLKASKTDNISDSGHVWNGHGDVRRVTTEQAAKLRPHRDVWEILDSEPEAAPAPAPAPASAAPDPALQQGANQAPADQAKTNGSGEPKKPADGAQYLLPQGEGQLLDLSGLNNDQLRAFADSQALAVDRRKTGDNLRAAIVEAYATKAAAATNTAAG